MSAARKARRSKAMTRDVQTFRAPSRRTRYRISQSSARRPRLSVFRSGKHIYAQVIDDGQGRDPGLGLDATRKEGKGQTWNVAAASRSARRSPSAHWPKASSRSCSTAVAIIYHGRVKALAEAAREGGLEF